MQSSGKIVHPKGNSKTLPIHFHVITFDLSFHRKPKKKILLLTWFSLPIQYVSYTEKLHSEIAFHFPQTITKKLQVKLN